jgi:hypothetical protein
MKKMFILALIFFWSLPAGADSFPETAPHIHVSPLGVSSMDWTRNRIVSGGAVYFRVVSSTESHCSVNIILK